MQHTNDHTGFFNLLREEQGVWTIIHPRRGYLAALPGDRVYQSYGGGMGPDVARVASIVSREVRWTHGERDAVAIVDGKFETAVATMATITAKDIVEGYWYDGSPGMSPRGNWLGHPVFLRPIQACVPGSPEFASETTLAPMTFEVMWVGGNETCPLTTPRLRGCAYGVDLIKVVMDHHHDEIKIVADVGDGRRLDVRVHDVFSPEAAMFGGCVLCSAERQAS